MRYESFVYGEYRYEKRNAEGDSSDLTDAHEIRIGIDGIMPQARTRRLVGNAYVGYRVEQYDAADTAGSLGAGHDEDVSLFTAGDRLDLPPEPVHERVALLHARQRLLGARELQHGRHRHARRHARTSRTSSSAASPRPGRASSPRTTTPATA